MPGRLVLQFTGLFIAGCGWDDFPTQEILSTVHESRPTEQSAYSSVAALSLYILQPNCTVCSSRIAASSGGGASKANNVRAYIVFLGASLVTVVWVNGDSVKLPSEHHTKHVLSAFSAKLLFVAGDGSCRDSQLAKVLEKK